MAHTYAPSVFARAARGARFAAAGIAATLLHWACMAALIAAGSDARLATALGALAGAALNYPLQHRHTFSSTRAHGSALPRYLAACAVGWLANLLLFALLHGPVALAAPIAQALTTVAVAALNYLLYARMVFHEPAPAQAAG